MDFRSNYIVSSWFDLSFVLSSFINTNTRREEIRNQTKLKSFDRRLIIRHSSNICETETLEIVRLQEKNQGKSEHRKDLISDFGFISCYEHDT